MLARFMDYYSTFWVPKAISMVVEPHGPLGVSVVNNRVFGRCWPVSWTITQRFGFPKRFPWLLNPMVRLACRSSTLAILADSGPFHGLSLTDLGSVSDFHD